MLNEIAERKVKLRRRHATDSGSKPPLRRGISVATSTNQDDGPASGAILRLRAGLFRQARCNRRPGCGLGVWRHRAPHRRAQSDQASSLRRGNVATPNDSDARKWAFGALQRQFSASWRIVRPKVVPLLPRSLRAKSRTLRHRNVPPHRPCARFRKAALPTCRSTSSPTRWPRVSFLKWSMSHRISASVRLCLSARSRISSIRCWKVRRL